MECLPENQYYSLTEYAILLMLLFMFYYTFKYFYWKINNHKIKAKAKQYVKERNSRSYKFLDQQIHQEELILSLDVTQLREHLHKQTFTCRDLVIVFSKRCYDIGRQYNLTTHEYFEEALQTAEHKDQLLQQAIKTNTVSQLPMLHGIPISVKNCALIKGQISDNGCEYLIDKINDRDCVTAQLLKEAGAIILVKGNVPQLCYSIHTTNEIWGTAQNPWNKNRSCAGSSGGEAGLVAARCIPLSVGNDLGGSIRLPAAFTGVKGFKPSNGRSSSDGQVYGTKDNFIEFNHIKLAWGPIGRSVDDLKLLLDIQFNPTINHIDPLLQPCPFRNDLYLKAKEGKNIRIGYFDSLPTFPSTQAVKRAISITKQVLSDQGYELVPFQLSLSEVEELRNVFIGLLANGFISQLFDNLIANYECPLSLYTLTLFYFRTNPILRKLINTLLLLSGNRRVTSMLRNLRPINNISGLVKKQQELMQKMRQKWQEEYNIQALICPCFHSCAFKSENAQDMIALLDYLIIWDIINYPCGVLPITQVQDKEQLYEDDRYNDKFSKIIKLDVKESKRMPIGIQIVSYVYDDEIALGVMKAIEHKINFNFYAL